MANPKSRREFLLTTGAVLAFPGELTADAALPKIPVYYGSFDGQAARFDAWLEAWLLNEGRTEWTEAHSTMVCQEVRELSKAEFDERFPDAPPLPKSAFKRLARMLAELAPSEREIVWLVLTHHPERSLAEALAILEARWPVATAGAFSG